jgi:hypothetical protein
VDDLIVFLRARLDEDARRGNERDECWHTLHCGWQLGEEIIDECSCGVPARTLAEVDAKQRVIEQYEDHRRAMEHGVAGVSTRYLAYEVHKVLRLLALPYAGHPAYQEEWRP